MVAYVELLRRDRCVVKGGNRQRTWLTELLANARFYLDVLKLASNSSTSFHARDIILFWSKFSKSRCNGIGFEHQSTIDEKSNERTYSDEVIC